jgi:hypothetical protein
MLSDPFARVLADRRAELNARFAEARHRLPGLDPAAFGDFLRDAVDPVVRAAHGAAPERVEAVALAAYDVALEVMGLRLVEGEARGAAIRDTWRRVLPAVARALAADPQRLLAALTNAAHQVAATPGARAGGWVDDMARLGGRCAAGDELRRLGQVAAWRAGLAHYRAGAIAAAAALPEPLALAATGAPADARWGDVARGLAASEWFDPAGADAARASGPRVAATVGAFRGFGGLFAEPPSVAIADGGLRVTSGDDAWLLTADRFGATFHRLPPATDGRAARQAALPAGLSVDRTGALTAPGGTLRLPAAGRVTSCAATTTTLAVTWSHSHQVTLVALA